MNNDLPIAQQTAFKQLTGGPFTTVDKAMEALLSSGMELTVPQEEYLREVLARVQHDAHELGYGEAMGWL